MGNEYIYGFGENDYGQLGLGDNELRYIPTINEYLDGCIEISAGTFHSLVLMNSGQIYAFGMNNKGQLGLGDTEPTFEPREMIFS